MTLSSIDETTGLVGGRDALTASYDAGYSPHQPCNHANSLASAALLQRSLLPRDNLRLSNLTVGYHYAPAEFVSGDCCGVFDTEDGIIFVLADISGKGIAASLLMSHLHATFRSLAASEVPLGRMVQVANQVLKESAPASLFATAVVGRITRDGVVEFVNAGHLPILHLRERDVSSEGATGIPLGMFPDVDFQIKRFFLAPGDMLFLYTDGLTEACNPSRQEFGVERARESLARRYGMCPTEVIAGCLADLEDFVGQTKQADDLTLLAIQRLRPLSDKEE
jgi:sigma-B regulation protein RsbU (phosphoserine phosphatase)